MIQQLGENADVPILGAVGAGWYGVFTQNGGPSGRWKEYTPIVRSKAEWYAPDSAHTVSTLRVVKPTL
ncbi:MAG: hypothetical protein R2867_14835 [Caldilineaceae bacterium]